MNNDIIYIRTGKGERALAESGELAPGLDKILGAIDGRSSIDVIRGRLDKISAGLVDVGLEALVEGELIRDVASAEPVSTSTPAEEHARKAQELRDKIRDRRKGGDRSRSSPAVDAWYKARREAEAQAAREAEEQARRTGDEQARRAEADMARRVVEEQNKRIAADQARRAAEEQAKRAIEELAKREADDQVRRAAEEQARRAAEEQARRAAEEQARRAAEEQARSAAEAQARRAAEDEARRKAEEQAGRAAEEERRKQEDKARQDAEETARRDAERVKQEAEEQARRAAEETARSTAASEEEREAAERTRQRAEVQARLMAEEAAWLEAEEKARADEEVARERGDAQTEPSSGKAASGKPRNLVKPAAIGGGALLVLGLAAIHLISFDGQIPQFEKALAGQFQQPVKIKALHLALVPGPHVRLDGVSIGAEGQIRVPTIRAGGSPGNLFGDKKAFKSIEMEAPVITEEGLGWILFGKRQAGDMAFGDVSAIGASLESKQISLPPLDAKLQFGGEGAWKTISIASADKNLEMLLTAKGQAAQLEIKARSFKVPFGSTLVLEDFVANGTADRTGIVLTDFKSFVHGGTLSGTARLKWGAVWSLAGEVAAKQIDTARVAPEVLGSARLEGTASYAMQASEAAKLFAWSHAEGSFTIPRGTLLGLDLGSVLQGGSTRGDTKFTELTGSFVHDQGATQLRQLRLIQANMSANGSIDIDAENRIRGRIAAELRLSTDLRRTSLSVTGTPAKLEWQR